MSTRSYKVILHCSYTVSIFSKWVQNPLKLFGRSLNRLEHYISNILKSDDMWHIYTVCTNRWKNQTISKMLFHIEAF